MEAYRRWPPPSVHPSQSRNFLSICQILSIWRTLYWRRLCFIY